MKRISAVLASLLFLTGCGRSPDNYGRQPEIPRTETTATTIAEEQTATSSTTSTAGYTVETTTSTALTAVLAAKQPKKAAIQETTAVSATEPVSSAVSADIQTEVQSTANITNTAITTYTTKSVVTTATHTTTTTVPLTSTQTTNVIEPPTEPKTILPNDGSDYGKAKAVYEYVRQNGGGTCVNRACQTYELCVDNGLDCCIVWTRAGLYGHVANIVRVEGIWYVLDTDGEFFLTYNNGFIEAVDIDGNHIADSSIISGKSYDELH